ncbi:MAG TPA: hypothetical protein PKI11_16755 [Candidatus Hydrogenedentes bacterium]|nr:hypothetical protein [Candidatus Hydrogenedentota bacterium]
MKSLIDDILAVEGKANTALEEARARAKALDLEADAELRRIEEGVATDVTRRIAEFRAEAEKKHADEAARAQSEHQQALRALEQTPEAVIATQARRVVARFREM